MYFNYLAPFLSFFFYERLTNFFNGILSFILHVENKWQVNGWEKTNDETKYLSINRLSVTERNNHHEWFLSFVTQQAVKINKQQLLSMPTGMKIILVN